MSASLSFNATPITGNPCRYLFTFTLTKGKKNIKSGNITFILRDGVSAPTEITPPNDNSPSTPPQLKFSKNIDGVGKEYTWSLPALSESKAFSFKADFSGAVNQALMSGQLSWSVYYTDNEFSGIQHVNTDVKAATACPMPPTGKPCCEGCSYKTVQLTGCDDYEEVNYADNELVFTPRGRKISVNLNLPAVCDKKDVVIGVYLTEVQQNGTEKAYAHRVIRRTAGGTSGSCVDNRDCNCVDFFIYDETACSTTTRTFRVRTKAHQLDNDYTTADNCSCNCPTQA